MQAVSRPRDSDNDTTAAAHSLHDAGYERAHHWREATRELVLVGAAAMAATHRPQSQGSISITLTGTALSNDLLIADTGTIALTTLSDHVDARRHQLRVVPMRLDILSELPVIRVLGRNLTEPMQLRLVIELTANNPHSDTTSVMACEYDSVHLDARMPFASLDFQLPGADLGR